MACLEHKCCLCFLLSAGWHRQSVTSSVLHVLQRQKSFSSFAKSSGRISVHVSPVMVMMMMMMSELQSDKLHTVIFSDSVKKLSCLLH